MMDDTWLVVAFWMLGVALGAVVGVFYGYHKGFTARAAREIVAHLRQHYHP